MKKKKNTIGWQKYEDLIEKQMSSPMLKTIIQQMMSYSTEIEDQEEDDEEDLYNTGPKQSSENSELPFLPISQQLMEDMAMLSNFDCWIGHTNFDITKEIKNILDKTEGIELLKVLSRYRFFIGIGQMFDFAEVRKDIEKKLL